MTTLLDDFEAYFTSQNLVGKYPVYKDTIQDKADDAIAIYEYGGTAPIPQVDGVSRAIQIVVRGSSVGAARSKISELYKSLLTPDGELYLTDVRWTKLRLKQTPFRFKVDQQGRPYYAFNLECITYYE